MDAGQATVPGWSTRPGRVRKSPSSSPPTTGRCACAGCSTRWRSRRSTRDRWEVVVGHDSHGRRDRRRCCATHPLARAGVLRHVAPRAGHRRPARQAQRGLARAARAADRVHRRRLPPAARLARARAGRRAPPPRRDRPGRDAARPRRGATCYARRTRARSDVDPPGGRGRRPATSSTRATLLERGRRLRRGASPAPARTPTSPCARARPAPRTSARPRWSPTTRSSRRRSPRAHARRRGAGATCRCWSSATRRSAASSRCGIFWKPHPRVAGARLRGLAARAPAARAPRCSSLPCASRMPCPTYGPRPRGRLRALSELPARRARRRRRDRRPGAAAACATGRSFSVRPLRLALLNPCFWPEVRRGAERLVHELADGPARARPPAAPHHERTPAAPARTVEDGVRDRRATGARPRGGFAGAASRTT